MTFLQIMAVGFALFALSRAFLRLRDREISIREFLMWGIIWLGVIIVALLPGTTIFFAELAGIGRGADLLLYISIILIFYLVFRLYVRFEHLEQDLTKLVREIALEKGSQRKK